MPPSKITDFFHSNQKHQQPSSLILPSNKCSNATSSSIKNSKKNNKNSSSSSSSSSKNKNLTSAFSSSSSSSSSTKEKEDKKYMYHLLDLQEDDYIVHPNDFASWSQSLQLEYICRYTGVTWTPDLLNDKPKTFQRILISHPQFAYNELPALMPEFNEWLAARFLPS